MQILDRDLPPELEALHQEVVDLRPEATIKFVRGMPAGARLEGRHEPDREGNSEIRLKEDFEFATLTHQLYHALYFRRGFPFASVLPFETSFSTVAQIINCAVSHAAMHIESRDKGLPAEYWRDKIVSLATLEGPDEPALSEEGILQAWYLADAIECDPEAVMELTQRCQDEYPKTWAIVSKLGEIMERCRVMGGLRWRRSMVELLEYFDGIAREHYPDILAPTKSVAISLVMTEPQATRQADRMIEIVQSDPSVAGFQHKQDRSLFHFRYLSPGAQKKELAELRSEIKRMRTEDFLNLYWVPYTVDLKATERTPASRR
jgi:hypothetical protein